MTPLMEQYFAIRTQYPDCLLLFQVGDFYELFFEQAQQAAPVLGIVLTSRGQHDEQPIPLCGVPMHAVNHYISKLIKAGFHVALCNQLEDAKPGTVVKRGVTQVLTPATLTDMRLLDEKHASYLCTCVVTQHSMALVFAELLTGQLHATTISTQDTRTIQAQLHRFMPDEVIVEAGKDTQTWHHFFKQQGFPISTPVPTTTSSSTSWIAQFSENTATIIQKNPVLTYALELLYAYLEKNQAGALCIFKTINLYKPEDFLILDAATQRNLELIKNTIDGSDKNTLFSILDKATTAMGSRMIKRWILSPLLNQQHIQARLDAVQILVNSIETTQQLIEHLAIGDMERTIGRIALDKAAPHDYLKLAQALAHIPVIKKLLEPLCTVAFIARINDSLVNSSTLHDLLIAALNDDTSHEYCIKPGFDHVLDTLRTTLDHAHEELLALEMREQEITKIASLKIRYNNIQGYYLEITKTHADLVPNSYKRLQTLAGKERYINPELQELEHRLLKARNEIKQAEHEAYQRIKAEVVPHIAMLKQSAYALATLDALVGFAVTAYDNNYAQPQIAQDSAIHIINGKHPMIAHIIGHNFITNDTHLADNKRFWIITGPNMGGKSTYLRQVALICLMAHCGSFVPAHSAHIPLLDRIFTRIGAGDNLAEGKSTFLVEMEETAAICLQATRNSLVILDEVGRGTSTHDGLALAQAILEYLYEHVGCSCLFATHYHELTHLEKHAPGITNYQAASKQSETGILFLHKIVPGAAQSSFGIEVARRAQLPEKIIARARELLMQAHANTPSPQPVAQSTPVKDNQHATLINQIKELDLENLSPRQAWDMLWKIKNNHL